MTERFIRQKTIPSSETQTRLVSNTPHRPEIVTKVMNILGLQKDHLGDYIPDGTAQRVTIKTPQLPFREIKLAAKEQLAAEQVEKRLEKPAIRQNIHPVDSLPSS